MQALSIIIVNWNTRDLLAQCLESVAENVGTWERGNVETFVVDNASTDGSPAMVRERFPWVRLIENTENVGFAQANNQAMMQARGRYVLLLNSDTVLGSNTLVDLIAFADAHPQSGIIGVQLLNPNGSYQSALNDFPTLITTILEGWGLIPIFHRNPYYPSRPPDKSQHPTTCDWVGGACLLARAQAIDQIGLLDETFFMNSEEVDWCYRMWQAGWQVWYTPEVKVVHFGGGSANRRSATQRMRLYEGKVRFMKKHHGVVVACITRLNFRISSGIKALVYWMRSLATHQDADIIQSRSHWNVFKSRNWL